MLYVSIFVELLRSRPAVAVALAALAQALLWALLPILFYTGPPGDVPLVLAIGHEFQLGSYLGPPLAFWVAELAFDIGKLSGVYLLSQACIVVTYWAVFSLGRSIAGAQHAALAVLLMVGIAAFTAPTPDFGPFTLAMPLWALVLLHGWRAVGERRRAYWLPLAVEVGLLLLTTYLGLLLVALLALFMLGHRRARSAINPIDALLALAVAALVWAPHLIWLAKIGGARRQLLAELHRPVTIGAGLTGWLRQLVVLVAAHAGFIVLIALMAGWPWPRRDPAPVIVRPPTDRLASHFVFYFGLLPASIGTLVGVVHESSTPFAAVAPLVVLSGLLVVVAAGEAIAFNRQHIVIATWFGLLLIPPLMAIAALLVLPWLKIDLKVTYPASAMARFFSESFDRRTSSPLRIVAGDPRTAALIALGPPRPSLYFDGAPERSPWVTPEALQSKGAVVVWPTTDTAGPLPPALAERFPALVPEVPRAFARSVQGRLPLLRIGWGVIRRQAEPTPPGPLPPGP